MADGGGGTGSSRPARATKGKVLADITPLRDSAAFRRLWLSGALSNTGTQMTNFAVALQVFIISGSSDRKSVV